MRNGKITLGAEIWRGLYVAYYVVKASDRSHFVSADGYSIEDIAARENPADFRRVLVEYDPYLGANGVQAVADALGRRYGYFSC